MRWSAAHVPDQRGRVAVVSGANTAIGFGAAAVLGGKSARVVTAVRAVDKGRATAARITAENPHADIAVPRLDLMTRVCS